MKMKIKMKERLGVEHGRLGSPLRKASETWDNRPYQV
jgi:hypothetical protein